MVREDSGAQSPRLALPPRIGIGLKPEHAPAILEHAPDVGWFEIHAENYMGAGGPPHRYLTAIRERYPLSLHGVGLSLGGGGPLDGQHLARLAALVKRYEPVMVSEHLAWSSHGGSYFNDLLPVPCTEEALRIVSEHVDEMQETLGRRILVENPSNYVEFDAADMDEIELLTELARRTGCGLLLDLNNVHVSAVNLGFDARRYLAAFPLRMVDELHLAGHAPERDSSGALILVDAHDRKVDDKVLRLLAAVVDRAGRLPTLIERDNDVPSWPMLHAEAEAVERYLLGLMQEATDAVAG